MSSFVRTLERAAKREVHWMGRGSRLPRPVKIDEPLADESDVR